MAACSGRRQFKFPGGRSYNENRSASRKTFSWPSLARTQPPPLLFLSSPLATLLSSRTAHAQRELFAYMDPADCRARHVNREHRRHFSFFSLSPSLPLSLSPFLSLPATQSFTGRGTPLFSTFSRRIRAARIKRLAYFRLIGRGDECTPRPEVFLYFAQFHSSRVYGVTRERYTRVSRKMAEDSRAFHLLKGRFENYCFHRFYVPCYVR